jgi:hypothetical protein
MFRLSVWNEFKVAARFRDATEESGLKNGGCAGQHVLRTADILRDTQFNWGKSFLFCVPIIKMHTSRKELNTAEIFSSPILSRLQMHHVHSRDCGMLLVVLNFLS